MTSAGATGSMSDGSRPVIGLSCGFGGGSRQWSPDDSATNNTRSVVGHPASAQGKSRVPWCPSRAGAACVLAFGTDVEIWDLPRVSKRTVAHQKVPLNRQDTPSTPPLTPQPNTA